MQSIYQPRAIMKTLEETGMSDSNPSPIPGTPGFSYTKNDSPNPPTPKTQEAELYRSTVCSLLHVAVWTRPDIATAVSKLARFLRNPGLKHWQQLKILLRYLKGSATKSLTFNFSKDSTAPGPVPAGENSPLVTFFDSSYADCPDTRRSTVGSITFLWGAAIDWRSKLYRRVTTASNKAEYCAGSQAIQRAKASHNILYALAIVTRSMPMIMYTDSNGAFGMINNPGPRPNSRQMDVIEHLLRQTETSGETVTKLISSADNPADLMTKCLSSTTHEKHTRSYLQVAPQTLISKQVERSATSLSAIQPFSFQNSPLVTLPTTEPEFFQDGLTFALISRNYSDEQLLLSKHKSLGHRNMEDVARLYSIPYKKIFCRDCVENKSTRHPLTGKSGRTLEAPRPGHTIDADVCSFPDKTKGGNSYLSVLIDRVSSRIDARLIRTPSDFFDHYTSFVKYCESHFGKTNIISVLHSDSAAYYLDSRRLADFNRARGIRQTFSPPYTQSLNGRAERTFRSIIEMARTCLNASGLGRVFYGEAIMFAVTVLNHLPKRGNTRTPDEIWEGREARSKVRDKFAPFGCAAWKQNFGPTKTKFDTNSTLQVHLNYDPEQNAYRVASLPDFKITYSAHLHFNKDLFPCKDEPLHRPRMDPRPFPNNFQASHFEANPDHNRSTRERAPSAQALRNLAAQAN